MAASGIHDNWPMPETPQAATDHRRRLLEAMGRCVAAKGYAETTIADVVGEAAVSRRTFYEHFPNKSDCLIALYEAASHQALKVLRSAIDPTAPWQAQIELALSAYLGCVGANPVLLRTLFIEILGMGPAGLAARRRINQHLANFMLQVTGSDATTTPLTPEMAMAVVGGINELVLQCMERNEVGQLQALVGPASQLVRAATQNPLAR